MKRDSTWKPTTIPRMLESSARKYPNREALVQGQTSLTYRELLERIYRLGNAFIELGVQPGDRVGIWLPNYPEWVIGSLASAAVGAVTVPINTRFREPEARYVLSEAGVSVLLTTKSFMTNQYLSMLERIVPEHRTGLKGALKSKALPTLRHVMTVREHGRESMQLEEVMADQLSRPSKELRRRLDASQPDDVVNMFWTSGTTANPKGVLATHRVLENIFYYARIFDYGPNDRCLAPMPFFYTSANYWAMLVALMHGACIVPLLYFTPEEALSTIERERVSFVLGTPNLYINYLKHQDFDSYSMDSVRAAWAGGATLPLEVIRQIKERMGVELFAQVYGMTETGGITTITPLDATLDVISRSVGKPLPNFELRLVDPESGKDVSPDKDGELWVRSPYNLKTYHGMSAEELKLFFPGDDWYRTGDVFQRDKNGLYHFRGRNKDMIKVGGENVAAREVENVLFSHPSVVQAAVLGVPDEERGEAIVAVVEVSEQIDENELGMYCRERLASFKVPRQFMFRDDWPTTATGKIQKYRLLKDSQNVDSTSSTVSST